MRIGTGLQLDIAAGASPLTAVWFSSATPVDASRTGFQADQDAPELQDSRLRRLQFQTLAYTSAIASDVGKAVVGAESGDSGTLVSYDNTYRQWWVLADDAADLFDYGAEVVSVTSGTGVGTAVGTAELGYAPESTDAISTSLTLNCGGTTVIGSYTDEQGLTCSLSGTFTPSTGAVALTGSGGDFALTIVLTLSAGVLSGSYPTGGITVARNASGSSVETRDVIAARGSAVTPAAGYYVDSLAGNDGNDGLTPATPKLTLAALPALSGGETIRFARGSRWREMFENPTLALTLREYGVGPRPIIDGFESVSAGGWAKTGGLTYVYERSHTPEEDPATQGAYVVLEDGIALVGVADSAACDALSGSFSAPAMSASGPYTVYIHASDDSDPTSNGKTYEIVTRGGIVLLGSTSEVRGLYVRGSVHEDSPVRFTESGAADDPLCYNTISGWGGKHSFYMPAGRAQYCGAVGMAPYNTTATAFVLNRNTPAGQTWSLYECFAINFPTVGLAMETEAWHCSPLNGHNNVSGTFGAITVDRFGAAYMNNGGSVRDCASVTWTDSLLEDWIVVSNGGANMLEAADDIDLTVQRCRFYGVLNPTTEGHRIIGAGGGTGTTKVEDSILLNSFSSGGSIYGNRAIQSTRNVFRNATTTNSRVALDDAGASAAYLAVGNILLAESEWCRLASGTLVAGTNLNLFEDGTARAQENGTKTFRAISTYLGDQSTYDPDSIVDAAIAFETGTDAGTRPTFEPTAAWLATLPAAYSGVVGPTQALPGGAGYVTPATYDDWKTFIDSR